MSDLPTMTDAEIEQLPLIYRGFAKFAKQMHECGIDSLEELHERIAQIRANRESKEGVHENI